MPARFKLHVSHSLVVAYLALFVALGGTAFAAATLTGRDVANGSLTGADLRNGSLTGSDLRNSSIRSADVKGITGADLGPGAEWTLRSPDKRFSLAVTNDGVTMKGPDAAVTVDAARVVVDGTASVDVRSDGQTRLRGSQTRLGNSASCVPLVNGAAYQGHLHGTGADSQPTSPPLQQGLLTSVFGCG